MEALLCSLLLFPSTGAANDGMVRPADDVPPLRVGRVIIKGNHTTKDQLVRDEIPMFPGQILDRRDLLVAEWNLLRRHHDKFYWWLGHRPRLRVDRGALVGEHRFRDVIVEFSEIRRD